MADANFSREQATKGYLVIADTSAHVLDFFGFSALNDTVISEILAPDAPGPENTGYDGDESGLAGKTLPKDYYPIRGSSITLTSGSIIAWRE